MVAASPHLHGSGRRVFKLEVEAVDGASARPVREEDRTPTRLRREERCHRPDDDRHPIPRRDSSEPPVENNATTTNKAALPAMPQNEGLRACPRIRGKTHLSF